MKGLLPGVVNTRRFGPPTDQHVKEDVDLRAVFGCSQKICQKNKILVECFHLKTGKLVKQQKRIGILPRHPAEALFSLPRTGISEFSFYFEPHVVLPSGILLVWPFLERGQEGQSTLKGGGLWI